MRPMIQKEGDSMSDNYTWEEQQNLATIEHWKERAEELEATLLALDTEVYMRHHVSELRTIGKETKASWLRGQAEMDRRKK